MWNSKKSAMLSIVVCFIFSVALTVGVFVGPQAVEFWFSHDVSRNSSSFDMVYFINIFKSCFYPSVPFAYVTLYSLIRLLFNIKKQEIFINKNVKYLRRISWCCFAVALITLIGGLFYRSFWFIAVAAAFVGLMLRIVKNVMENAVEIKAENELTI